jgi:cell division protein FtsQ
MEIRTIRKAPAPEAPPAPATPEAARYLRRQAPQKVRKQRKAGRILLALLRLGVRFAGLLGIVVLLAGTVYWALHSPAFALRTVTVRGCAHSDPRKIEAAVREMVPANLFSVSIPEVRVRVEQETWVRSAAVSRIFPSEIVVDVTERTGAAIVELGGTLMLADREGFVLDPYKSKQEGLDLPVFRGLAGRTVAEYRSKQEENAERVRVGLALLKELATASPIYVKNISEIDLSDTRNVRLLLVDDTAEIMLGDHDFLERFRMLMNNMERYREVKEKYIDIAAVDLRFDRQIVFKPRNGTDAQLTEQVEARP